MRFTARYPGPCAGCDELILTGDEVQFVENELVHVDCVPNPEPAPRPVCPKCWTEIALNGACSC